MSDLFANLPIQRRPVEIERGPFLLLRCVKCRGSGRHRYSAYSGDYHANRYSEPCPVCRGGGRVMVRGQSQK